MNVESQRFRVVILLPFSYFFLRMLVYIFLKRFWVDSYGIQLKNEKKIQNVFFWKFARTLAIVLKNFISACTGELAI